MADKEDLSLPKATVNKLIKESLPKDVKCNAQSQELILQCCLEFLQLLSSEANDICSQKNKKMISGEHVVEAVKKLGFNDYAPHLQQILEEHKRSEAVRPKSESKNKLRNSGLTHEELLKQQHELFALAKSAVQSSPAQTTQTIPSIPSIPNIANISSMPSLNANAGMPSFNVPLLNNQSLNMPDLTQ
eukprot:TRINITY_DN15834_c0_g1_i1.p1 TRINITY_DN15834_c0_g1~~TRINITY_DN15834_c0_g1_i1.p1  ORF type:complete len:188 (-),score=43.00 TRINITY_DN15834_c0_g1_i1:47-610(-)